MSSETGIAPAPQENKWSSNPTSGLQDQQSLDPNKSNGSDREGRKGGDDAEAR